MSVAPQEQGTKEPPGKDEVELTRRGGRTLSPLVLTILGGIGTALLAIGNNWFQWFQTQSAETLKLRAALIQKAMESPTAQARKDYLLFLIKAGLITDPGNKIRDLQPGEIPRQFGFVESTALSPELASALDRGLTDFRDHLRSSGLQADTTPQVNIRPEEQTRTGFICHYEVEAEGASQLIIDARYAEDIDLALREYSHHIMALNRPLGQPKYPKGDEASKTYWPHFAIESALAFYLPCSFRNNPKFAENAVRKGVFEIDLQKSHKLTELKADESAMYYEDAEIWGSLFWQLRAKLRSPKVDALLVRAWSTLNENASVQSQNKAFAAAIEQAVSKELGTDAGAAVKKIFKDQGLAL